MRIINLVENTEGHTHCSAAHGLSFFIETKKHKILVDAGPSEIFLENAKKLGIDLSEVDTVILSHGHYDHSGGLMAFAAINSEARIYMQRSAGGDFYSTAPIEESDSSGECRYIGIDKKIINLPQTVMIDGDLVLDEELQLFTLKNRSHDLPSANKSLKEKTGDDLVQDEFSHEQYLVISEEGRHVLISGCAHNGILSILDGYIERFGTEPDVVISGFHLMKKTGYTDEDILQIIRMARELKKKRTMFYTGHCTGLPAYEVMKNIMGDKLEYIHSGDSVLLKQPSGTSASKHKKSNMKWHKFFAGLACFGMVMTAFTGMIKK